ncbi:MAG TPA: zinc-ribbon domain-containing protein [Ktedonobacteraceae bacterium]|nr:zinc-ribbon domain-containing protein [Ktedonobacteraceae bacterium]
MAQQAATCPKCGTLATAGQRFCSNCGASLDISANQRTEYVTEEETQQAVQTPDASYAPAPPPVQTYQTPPPPPVYSAPPYAKPQKDSSKSVLGQIGCGVGIVILLVLALCGVASYFVYNGLRGFATDTASTNQTGSNVGSGGATNSGGTPTPQTPTVVSVNGKIIYAGVNITIVDTKQTNFFTDDASTSDQAGGIVRVSFKEENQMNASGSFLYSDIMRLLLPDGTSIVPGNEQYGIGPSAATTRNNWADFPVPLSIKSDQLTLRIGTTTEAQMDIPLKANTDVSKYQPKKVTPNKQTQYAGTSWTITDATDQLGYNGKQADKGMTFVIVSLKIDNTSSNDFRGYPGDYVRLRTGATVASPDIGCSLPLSVQAGQTNVTGTCAFLVPQGSTDYTFQLLPNPSTGATTDSTIPFQIQ